jgi:glycosyltransferase involved in cell wall biosynthesis
MNEFSTILAPSHEVFHMTPSAPLRLLLLIPHLGGGGAERVIELLARTLPQNKYELHLALITQAETGAVPLPPGLQVHTLGAPRVRAAALPLLRLIRRLKPDLILSGIFHLNFLLLLLRPLIPRRTRLLVRQNGTVSAALAFGDLPCYTRLLYRFLYRRAGRVICQSQAMAADLARELKLSPSRLAVLPNPVDIEEIRRFTALHPPLASASGPHLLAVGRLSREKGFDLLLRALPLVQPRFPGVTLLIAGAGPEETALKSLCRELALDSAVRFAGSIHAPWTLFPEATLFVLPSRHEGLPNALLEAAAGGLPIVALPASEGVVELLRGQHGVWLAAGISTQALAASLLDALGSLQPGQRFQHPFVEPFRIDRAIQAYESLIDSSLESARIT